MTFENMLRRLCLFSLEKRRLRRGGSNSCVQLPRGGLQSTRSDFSEVHSKRMRGNRQVTVKGFLIKHIEKNLFTAEMVIHRKRLPTVASKSPFLEIQNSSGLGLSNLIQLQRLTCFAWRTEADDLQRPHLA